MRHFLSLLFLLSVWLLPAAEAPKTEIRAVWLTTIYGLDWPTKPATTAAGVKAQQDELCAILDKLEDANFNTVFLQVRMRGDVIYRSAIEPASRTFSGTYGKMPAYDPLAYAIEECHKRGMECHAWFVTFPVGTDKIVREQGARSVVKKKPALVKRYRNEWYLDPGVPETSDYLLSMVQELVAAYDIDGIHFDYIRYPEYATAFPDRMVYNKYGKGKTQADWRRENINRIVARLYDGVKALKPWVQVSSSPIGKYNNVEQVPNAGWTAFHSVYQDPANWMEQGKHDMIVPMMYYLNNDFFPFVDNWMANSHGRLFVPGLGAYRMDKSEADWSLANITDQIDYTRRYGTAGSAFFRTAHVMNNHKGLYDQLKNTYYRYPAQLPPLTWLNDSIPASPAEIRVERTDNELRLSWDRPADASQPLTYTVYYSLSDSIDLDAPASILATRVRTTELFLPITPGLERGYLFSISASTRYHLESLPSPETFYYQSEFVK